MTKTLNLGGPYQSYAYSYPHKSAYRSFAEPRRLRDVWAGEAKDRLFLYVHLPFCEMRCGFCNLFTTANPKEDLVTRYLRALETETEAVASELGPVAVRQMAIGGGTPTYLEADALDTLFRILAQRFDARPATIPCSVETSPKTATPDRLSVLASHGVQRLSIGVQSFDEQETRAMGRPQTPQALSAALDAIRDTERFSLNIDLMYGATGQSTESFSASIRRALEWAPESLYLYPLYIRPRTGLDGRADVWDQARLMLYRAGRDLLLAQGFEQISMRHFRRIGGENAADAEYVCQEDGMIGLGAGARSYTSEAHYSSEFAVTRRSVLSIIDGYCDQSRGGFRFVDHGCDLTEGDKMRRYILKSILHSDGLDVARFAALFGMTPTAALPDLRRLMDAGYVAQTASHITPTRKGLEWADAIGPYLYSAAVTERMNAYEIA